MTALTSLSRATCNTSGNTVPVLTDQSGSVLTSQGLPPYTEMVRRGEGWSVMNTAAIAALVARPSTLSNLTLWNGEPDNGKSYVIDRIFTHNLVTNTADGRFGMWAVVHPQGMTKPTADITAIKGLSGQSNYGGLAIVDLAATVVADGWFPWGNSVSYELTGALPGAQIAVEVAGRMIVPPSAGISLQVVASTTTDTFTTGFSWYEVNLTHG